MATVVRKQKPSDLTDYKKYKPFLRLDFEKRCAYCHIPESRYGPTRNYTVDHFRPKSKAEFLKLICVYSNLYYVCQDCNSWKGSVWPQAEMQALGFRFLDPCLDDFSQHWTIDRDGFVQAQTTAGEYMVARVQLNRPFLRRWRRRKGELALQVREAAELVAAIPMDIPEHVIARRMLARLERTLFEEYGNFWC